MFLGSALRSPETKVGAVHRGVAALRVEIERNPDYGKPPRPVQTSGEKVENEHLERD